MVRAGGEGANIQADRILAIVADFAREDDATVHIRDLELPQVGILAGQFH
jgi:hypothetical protein